jgi:pimeloyl-ACP methyl ester carboxylesterase
MRPKLLVILLLLTLAGGCAETNYVSLRGVPHNPLAESLSFGSKSGPQPSPRTMQFLRSYNLVDALDGDPWALLNSVQQIIDRDASADARYAIAELAYVSGAKLQAKNDLRGAMDLYGAAVAHAYLFLIDPRFDDVRNPYDPQFRRACEVYNGGLEAALRIARTDGRLHPGASETVGCAGHQWEITIAAPDSHWPDQDFGKVQFVSDYEIKGLQNHYHTYGLGVPLIITRSGHSPTDPADPYYAPGLSFAATAFLRIQPEVNSSADGSKKLHHAVLELHDPLATTDVVLCNRRVPLETDLSTPLAYCLDDPAFQQLDQSTFGLLHPDSTKVKSGLYMLDPYQPNKIPVLMIHGLWSSPITWMEMFNDLRAQPELRNNYQFWFYMYPTGQPFWQSAAELRQALVELRTKLDPNHQSPALDQMVLVGHSMGGLVARLQTLDSGDDFWHLNADKPFRMVKADYSLRGTLGQEYFFQPNPSVRRVITIATPHRGSSFSNDTTQFLARKLIALPKAMLQNEQWLRRENPDYFLKNALIDVTTSIDSLSPQSAILPVMLGTPRGPWITYHNIVGRLSRRDFLGRVAGDGDGVVPYGSAHLDDVASEIIVPADHTEVHRHPLSVLEVRRILLMQLDELRHNPYGPPRMLAARPSELFGPPPGGVIRAMATGPARY